MQAGRKKHGLSMIDIGAWLREFRYRFLLFVSLPVLLGAAIAYMYYPASFSLGYFLLSIIAMLLLHSGTIIINDYFDFRSGTDILNQARAPYSGGSGLLPEKALKPWHVLIVGTGCFALCIIIGLLIVLARGPAILLIGFAGVCLGVAYTAPPFKLCYRGLGEIARLAATPLIVLGAFFVQVPVTSIPELISIYPALVICVVASLPVAFFNMAAMYIFEFPDYEADRQVGKKNLVVRLGTKNASYLYLIMQAAAYGSLIFAMLAGIIPWLAAIILLLLPASAYAATGLLRYNAEAKKLLPYLRATSNVYILASIILVLAYIIRF
ncbi:prenyltransferase [Methanocella arvoryzae]|uniref:1,4-dihydroxy-2-naphthoate octaprenyltransferase n=1 Tax=Methanocella arvoryzae (strain DSM 22066 / NBRC 105507 / MRE50) TaxID=351160 RepID=Q0W272_METAR|nr:prenyltransferase [Methanocella arvoryzae]CAJ37521.1 putative 1,4-dihydroxy-2-naphthoate octaprenyltransferase [Methanocella arvoryzae MRE50]